MGAAGRPRQRHHHSRRHRAQPLGTRRLRTPPARARPLPGQPVILPHCHRQWPGADPGSPGRAVLPASPIRRYWVLPDQYRRRWDGTTASHPTPPIPGSLIFDAPASLRAPQPPAQGEGSGHCSQAAAGQAFTRLSNREPGLRRRRCECRSPRSVSLESDSVRDTPIAASDNGGSACVLWSVRRHSP